MPPEKTAVNEFLEGLKTQQEDPFKDVEVKQEADTPTTEEEEEKPIPFHKDPKVQRYVEKQIAKALEGVKPNEAATSRKDTEDEVTDVLTRIIGNDTPEKVQGVKDLRKVLGSLEDKGAEKALQKFQQQQAAAVEQDRKAQSELDEYFEEIEETYNVDLSSNAPTARKNRSEFIDYVRKIAPKNEDGEVSAFPDLVAAFEEFQEKAKRPAPASRAKELAARSMSQSTDASTTKPTGGITWKTIDKLFS